MSEHSTQCDELERMFTAAGTIGLFSGDLRRAGFGNPSQRVEDLRGRGYTFREARQRYASGRGFGMRWWVVSAPSRVPESSAPSESRHDSGLAQAPKSPLLAVAALEGQTPPRVVQLELFAEPARRYLDAA
jgi:hypothetical protein